MLKKSISIILSVIVVIAMTPMAAIADTTIDKNPPKLNDVSIVDHDVDLSKESVRLSIDITEGGSGVRNVQAVFKKEGSDKYYYMEWPNTCVEDEDMDDPIFTGVHEIEMTSWSGSWLSNGSFYLETIYMIDLNGNRSETHEFSRERAKEKNLVLNVSNSFDEPVFDVSITDISFPEGDNVDATGELAADITLSEGKCTMRDLSMQITDSESGADYHLRSEAVLKAGTNRVLFTFENMPPKGTYDVDCIFYNIYDPREYYEYDNYFCKNKSFKITKSDKRRYDGKFEYIPGSLSFESKEIHTPGLLKGEISVRDYDLEAKRISISLNSKERFLNIADYSPVLVKREDGISTYSFSCPVTPFFVDGTAMLYNICVTSEDDSIYSNFSFSEERYPELYNDRCSFKLDSGLNISYFGSTANSAAVKKVKELSSHRTAVLDCRAKHTASKAFFEAIAGRNVNLVFIDDNVQWVFNGKDVSLDKCKDISLKNNISAVSGAEYGFADDKKIILLEFADNGELPGEVEMRVNEEYISKLYKLNTDGVYVSYIKDNGTNELEEDDVEVAEDEYYEFDIDHNSDFSMSNHKSSLGSTTLSSVPYSNKSIKLTWKKRSAATGYYIYRSTKKSGTYKKIATVKGGKKTYYIDKNKTPGKTYYYKIKPYSTKKSLNSTAKISKIYSTHSRLKTPIFEEAPDNIAKGVLQLRWKRVSGAKYYYIYRATSQKGTYKKIAKVGSGTTTYKNKGLKKGKMYYYKVKAISKYSKCTSCYSRDVSEKVRK